MSARWEIWETRGVYVLEHPCGRHEYAGLQRRVAVFTSTRAEAEQVLRLFGGDAR